MAISPVAPRINPISAPLSGSSFNIAYITIGSKIRSSVNEATVTTQIFPVAWYPSQYANTKLMPATQISIIGFKNIDGVSNGRPGSFEAYTSL